MYIHTYMPNIRDLVCPLIRLRLKAPTKSPSDWINPVETIYCPKEYRKQDRCCNAGSQRMWNSWLWQAKGLCVLSQRSLCVSSYLVLVSQQFFIEKETAGSRGVTPGLQNKPQNRRNSFPTEWLNTIWLLASMKTNRIGCVNNISGYKSVSQAGIRNLFSPECGLLRVLTQIFWQNACCFPHKYLYLPRMHHTHTHTHTKYPLSWQPKPEGFGVSYRGISTCRRLRTWTSIIVSVSLYLYLLTSHGRINLSCVHKFWTPFLVLGNRIHNPQKCS